MSKLLAGAHGVVQHEGVWQLRGAGVGLMGMTNGGSAQMWQCRDGWCCYEEHQKKCYDDFVGGKII